MFSYPILPVKRFSKFSDFHVQLGPQFKCTCIEVCALYVAAATVCCLILKPVTVTVPTGDCIVSGAVEKPPRDSV